MSNEGMVNNVMERELVSCSWRWSWSVVGACWLGGGRTATNGDGDGRMGCAEDGLGGRCRRSKWRADRCGIDRVEPLEVRGELYVELDVDKAKSCGAGG